MCEGRGQSLSGVVDNGRIVDRQVSATGASVTCDAQGSRSRCEPDFTFGKTDVHAAIVKDGEAGRAGNLFVFERGHGLAVEQALVARVNR